LSAEEEALLVAAATGVTGVVREEWSFLDAEGGPTGLEYSHRHLESRVLGVSGQ
jgi:hypothetical protein